MGDEGYIDGPCACRMRISTGVKAEFDNRMELL
jgi:hypothetical protein